MGLRIHDLAGFSEGNLENSRLLAEVAQEEKWRIASRALSRGRNLLRQLRGLVLLGGTVRPGALQTAIGRSTLDLPVRTGCSVMDCWRAEATKLVPLSDQRPLAIRVILDRSSPEPAVLNGGGQTVVAVERDPIEFRGTGGVLRDLAMGYDDNDFLLVATMAQLLEKPLVSMALSLEAMNADIAIISHKDRTPSGLMLVRCACLKRIASRGFVDMKEQALGALAAHFNVRVVEEDRPTSVPIRTLFQYIDGLRRHHRQLAGETSDAPFQEHWNPTFSIMEKTDDVHPTARIHDSVVLKGARVEDKAVVIGSIICPGAVVRRGEMVVDELITTNRRSR